MLSTSAFNALLKTLEEPPDHVILILATTEPHKILPTIVSRCQRFDFRRIPRSAMVARLRYIAEQEGIEIDDEALGFVARSATGSARDAISLLDQLTAYGDERITVERLRDVLGLSDVELVYQLAGCMAAHDVGRGLALIHQAVVQGADVRQFTQQVVEYLRAALVVRVGGSAESIEMDARTRVEIDALVKACSARDLLRAVQLFNQAQLDLRGHDQGQLALELAFVEAALMPEPVAFPGPAQPEQQAQLEQRASQGHVLMEGGAALDAYATAPPPSTLQAQPAHTERVSGRDAAADKGAVAGQGMVPPAAPPRATPRALTREAAQREPAVQTSELGQASESISAEYVSSIRGEISAALRAEGPDGRKADGLFGTVFHIGEIKVLGGSEILFALPRGVYAQADSESDQVLERVLCSVLGRNVRARFVDKARLDEYKPSRSAEGSAQEASPEPQAAQAPGAPSSPADPYEEAKLDPVVQNLVRRGGQVTQVELSE